MVVTAGVCLSLAFFRRGVTNPRELAVAMIAGSFYLGGTLGSLIGNFCFGTEQAGENGFLLGGVMATLIVLAIRF